MIEEFSVLKFDNWAELRRCFDHFRSNRVFRGQRRAEWPLRSSLERVAHYKPEDREKVEQFFLFQFKRRAHNYLSASPLPKDEGDILEWLALMQHHGAPTRLLDFTKSPYVASFFAIENAESESAVWAIDADWFLDATVSQIWEKLNHAIGQTSLKFELSNPETLSRKFEQFFLNPPPIQSVLKVEPYRMNERLTVQQGCFLCPGDLRRSFQENLLGSGEPDQAQGNVKKMVISPEIREEILYDLYTMNINRASLFPGIDGFAQSLKHQLVSPEQEHLARMFSERNVDRVIEDKRKKCAEAGKD